VALCCAGTATLLPDGLTALVPLATLGPHGEVHLRNGLGQTRLARVTERSTASGVARLHCAQPLPLPAGLSAAARAPFAGSPLAVVEFGADDGGEAAWPQLVQGFAGTMAGDGSQRLGVELPRGARGGPVFDRHGQLAGIAWPTADGPDRLWRLEAAGEAAGGQGADPSTAAAAPVDAVYESALRLALQVLVPRGA
jgi:hypothetical protein